MKVTIESIGDIQEIGSKGFTKLEFVAVDNSNSQYPQPIKFELTKDNTSLIDGISIGQEIDVDFNIRGNRWTNPQGKEVIFNTLQVWKIFGGEQAPNPVGTPQAAPFLTGNDDFDLPF